MMHKFPLKNNHGSLGFKAYDHRRKKMFQVTRIDYSKNRTVINFSGGAFIFGTYGYDLIEPTPWISVSGNVIYEGDILRSDKVSSKGYKLNVVQWDKEACHWGVLSLKGHSYSLRVHMEMAKGVTAIGNMFENPEKLETKSND